MIKTVKAAHFAYFIDFVSTADQQNFCTLNSYINKIINKIDVVIFFESFTEI